MFVHCSYTYVCLNPNSVNIPPSTATPQAQLTEFKERLNAAATASQLTPTIPSISIHRVTSDYPQ